MWGGIAHVVRVRAKFALSPGARVIAIHDARMGDRRSKLRLTRRYYRLEDCAGFVDPEDAA